MNGDEFFMHHALQEAWKYQLLTYPNPAVGAAVEKEGALLSVSAHREAGGPHAEVYAIKEAFERITGTTVAATDSFSIHDFLLANHNNIFHQCTIYTTLEPCNHVGKTPSCANLIQKLGFKRVIIGCLDDNAAAAGGKQRLRNVTTGVLLKECEALLQPFKIWQKRAFVFFKLAQTHNGKITGGYLSCKESLTHVHRLRSKLSTLLIGGNTVKVDRPTLDCRLIQASAPDVHIYSTRNFDKDIALFGVSDRKVTVSKDLSFLNNPGLVMVEGGENMLKSVQNKIDWVLTYQTPDFSRGKGYDANFASKVLHYATSHRDLMIWSKVENEKRE